MIFTQFNMEDALEVRGEEKFAEGEAKGRAEGEAKGKAEGEAIGELQKLISQVRKKHAKGLSVGAIAEMLEEDPASISSIMEELVKDPEVSDEELIQKLGHTDT